MVDWFILFHLLGAVQGVFLAAILASKRRSSVATKILAVIMLALAIELTMAVYHAAGYDELFPHLIGFDYALPLLYGPLFYLYAKTLSNQENVFKSSNFWHLLPFAVVLVVLIPFYLQSGLEKQAYLNDSGSNFWAQGLIFFSNVKLLHGLVYVGLTLIVVKQYHQRIRNRFSSIERINLYWLRNLMAGLIILVFIAIVFHVLTLQGTSPAMGLNTTTLNDDYTLLSLAIFVFIAGFMGLRQPEVFDNPAEKPLDLVSVAKPDVPVLEKNAKIGDRPRYIKSGMDVTTAQGYKEKLLVLMDTEKLYQRGDLTLHELANALSISPHNLTEVINTQFDQNFYDFINGYRVREVKERLLDPEFAHYTLLAIALESGFNSKSSFNAVFKKHTQMTPSRYRKQGMTVS